MRLASPSNVFAEPDPVITLLSALLLIVVPDAAAHDTSVPSLVNTSLAPPTVYAAGSPLASP